MRPGSIFRKVAGFTLLEGLIAFSIASVSLGILYKIYAQGSLASSLGNKYADALIIAESSLHDISKEQLEDNAQFASSFEDGYQVNITIEDYQPEADDKPRAEILKLKKVSVTVHWDSDAKKRRLALSTLKPLSFQR